MGEYDKNPYYNPAGLGLTKVAEIDYSDQLYVFDTRVVWKDAEGNKYTARDSGCSCPTPFEDYCAIEKLDKFNYDQIRAEVQSELSKEESHITAQEAQEFLKKVRS